MNQVMIRCCCLAQVFQWMETKTMFIKASGLPMNFSNSSSFKFASNLGIASGFPYPCTVLMARDFNFKLPSRVQTDSKFAALSPSAFTFWKPFTKLSASNWMFADVTWSFRRVGKVSLQKLAIWSAVAIEIVNSFRTNRSSRLKNSSESILCKLKLRFSSFVKSHTSANSLLLMSAWISSDFSWLWVCRISTSRWLLVILAFFRVSSLSESTSTLTGLKFSSSIVLWHSKIRARTAPVGGTLCRELSKDNFWRTSAGSSKINFASSTLHVKLATFASSLSRAVEATAGLHKLTSITISRSLGRELKILMRLPSVVAVKSTHIFRSSFRKRDRISISLIIEKLSKFQIRIETSSNSLFDRMINLYWLRFSCKDVEALRDFLRTRERSLSRLLRPTGIFSLLAGKSLRKNLHKSASKAFYLAPSWKSPSAPRSGVHRVDFSISFGLNVNNSVTKIENLFT